jgi:hypothetical protein
MATPRPACPSIGPGSAATVAPNIENCVSKAQHPYHAGDESDAWPSAGRRLDDRRVDWVRAGEIEFRGDHDQLARDASERAVLLPERLQTTEEAAPFFWKGTLAQARTGDRTFEEFFKHGRTPFWNPPILSAYLRLGHGIDVLVSEPESTRRIRIRWTPLRSESVA